MVLKVGGWEGGEGGTEGSNEGGRRGRVCGRMLIWSSQECEEFNEMRHPVNMASGRWGIMGIA